MSIPVKLTPTCSNIFLINENLCLANSLNIINYNVSSLSSALGFLENYQAHWSNLYSTFQTYSAIWIQSVTNVQTFSSNWVSFSNTVISLSGDWQKPYTIFYPQMLEINSWYAESPTDRNDYIINWLNLNFSPNNYNDKQIINVTVYLYEEQLVSFNFSRSYDESCTPNCTGVSVSCSAGSCPGLYQGCNHHGGLAGVKGCDNVYSYCSQQATFSAPQNVSCVGHGGRTLSVALNQNSLDTHVSQTINIPFINTNNNWVLKQ